MKQLEFDINLRLYSFSNFVMNFWCHYVPRGSEQIYTFPYIFLIETYSTEYPKHQIKSLPVLSRLHWLKSNHLLVKLFVCLFSFPGKLWIIVYIWLCLAKRRCQFKASSPPLCFWLTGSKPPADMPVYELRPQPSLDGFPLPPHV